MGSTGRITKGTRVWEAEKLLTIAAIAVDVKQTLEEIAEKLADSPACKTLAVVDGAGKLAGVIPASLIVDAIFVRVMPEEFLADIEDVDTAVDFARKVGVSRAEGLMQAPVWVKMDDTVKDAFDRMHKSQLSGVPIVDDHIHVIGYLDMLELLLVWLKTKGE